MKKALIAALIVASLLLAAAVGVVVYLEMGKQDNPAGTTPGTTEGVPAESQSSGTSAPVETQEATEATVGISLPTENPDEVGPAYTWSEDETGAPETVATEDPDATHDPDENETPNMGI